MTVFQALRAMLKNHLYQPETGHKKPPVQKGQTPATPRHIGSALR